MTKLFKHGSLVLVMFLWVGMTPNINAQNFLIEEVNVVEVRSGIILPDQYVLVENGRIKKTGKKRIKCAYEKISGKGKYLMPGMIDAYVTMFHSGGLYSNPGMLDLEQYKPYILERKEQEAALESTLENYAKLGITSVGDRGGSMTQLEKRGNVNPATTANLYTTGPLLTNYMLPPLDLDEQNLPYVQVDISTMPQWIYREMTLGPNYIMLALRGADKSDEELIQMLEEAQKLADANRVPLMVSALDLKTAKLALSKGVKFLAHGIVDQLVDQEFIDLMKKNNVVYIPMVSSFRNYVNTYTKAHSFNEDQLKKADPIALGSLGDMIHIHAKDEKLRQLLKMREERGPNKDSIEWRLLKNLRIMADNKVPLALGSDAGNLGSLHGLAFFQELEMFKKAGLTNKQIIRAMTLGSATSLGILSQTGEIRQGANADFIMLNENPLEKLEAIERPEQVFVKGNKINTTGDDKKTDPVRIVQTQLNAYNYGRLDAYMEVFSEDIKVYTFPKQTMFTSKKLMRAAYEMLFARNPDLHCELVDRIVAGNTVIDQEHVTGMDGKAVDAIAIYKIKDGKINEIYFMNP